MPPEAPVTRTAAPSSPRSMTGECAAGEREDGARRRAGMTPGLALLPLRLFLGATFVYAGLHKLTDGGFLHEGSPTYIGTQLEGFASGTPGGWVLETFALPMPEVAGAGVALTEIAVGLLTLAGRFTRA